MPPLRVWLVTHTQRSEARVPRRTGWGRWRVGAHARPHRAPALCCLTSRGTQCGQVWSFCSASLETLMLWVSLRRFHVDTLCFKSKPCVDESSCVWGLELACGQWAALSREQLTRVPRGTAHTAPGAASVLTAIEKNASQKLQATQGSQALEGLPRV